MYIIHMINLLTTCFFPTSVAKAESAKSCPK